MTLSDNIISYVMSMSNNLKTKIIIIIIIYIIRYIIKNIYFILIIFKKASTKFNIGINNIMTKYDWNG